MPIVVLHLQTLFQLTPYTILPKSPHPIHPCSRPSPHQAHQKRAKKHQKTRNHPLPTPKNLPTRIAQKILRHELDQGRKDEEASRNGIHDADDEKADFRIG